MAANGSGFTAFAPHHPTENLPISRGPHAQDHNLTRERINWPDLAAELTTPTVGEKGGPYVAFGHYQKVVTLKDGTEAEVRDYLDGDSFRSLSLFGFDGDKTETVDEETGEVKEVVGCCAPREASAAFTAAGLQHCLWTTHSHGAEGIGNRWRSAHTLTRPIVDVTELRAVEAWLRVQVLGAAGLAVARSTESWNPARLWYTPRVEADRLALFFAARNDDGLPVDVDAALAWYNAEYLPLQRTRYAAPGEPGSNCAAAADGGSIFGWFTASLNNPDDPTVGVERLRAYLERRGYHGASVDRHDGVLGYRMVAPGSNSGTAGVHVIRDKNLPHATVHSFHGGHDPLAREEMGAAGDTGSTIATAVGLLDFGGDWAALGQWLEWLRGDVETAAAKTKLLDGVGSHAPALEALARLDPEAPAFATEVAALHKASKRAFGLRDIKKWAAQLRELSAHQTQVTVEAGTWWPAIDKDGRAVDLEKVEAVRQQRAEARRAQVLADALEAFRNCWGYDADGILHKPAPPRPVVYLPTGETSFTAAARDIFDVLAVRQAAFQKGRKVVTLEQEPEHAGRDAAANRDGRLQIEPMDVQRFRSFLEKYMVLRAIRLDKYGEPRDNAAICSAEQARGLLGAQDIFVGLLDPLYLVASQPVLHEADGKLTRLEKGYHREAGIYVLTDTDIPAVDIATACRDLLALLQDFRFQTESDKSRAVASMLTVRMKMARLFGAEPTPLDLFEADKSQAGKTLLDKLIALVNGELAYQITQKHRGVGSLDESLQTAFTKGRPRIRLDNFRGEILSPTLEAALTSTTDPLGARAAYAAEVLADLSRVTIACTSQGVTMTPDLANRINLIRILKQPDGYRWHRWPEGPLRAHVAANQGHYLGCLDSIILDWHKQGRKHNNVIGHEMRFWAGIMDHIVRHYFGMPPLLTGHEALRVRLSNPQIGWLRTVCQAIEQTGQIGHSIGAREIFELCEEQNIEFPNKVRYFGNAEDKGIKYVGRILGGFFKDCPSSGPFAKCYVVVDSRWCVSRVGMDYSYTHKRVDGVERTEMRTKWYYFFMEFTEEKSREPRAKFLHC